MGRLLLVVAVLPVFALVLGAVIAVGMRYGRPAADGRAPRRTVERLAPVLYAGVVAAAALVAASLAGFDPRALGLWTAEPLGTGGSVLIGAAVAGGAVAGAVGYLGELVWAERALARRGSGPPGTGDPAVRPGGSPAASAAVRRDVPSATGAAVPRGRPWTTGAGPENGDSPGATDPQDKRSAAAAGRGTVPQGNGDARRPERGGTAGMRAAGAWAGSPRALFALGFVTAVAEEVLFRGYLLTGLREAVPLGAALVLQALLFGAHHASFGLRAVPAKAAHGLVWGASAVLAGTLLPALTAHLVFQFLACRRMARRKARDIPEGGTRDDGAHGSTAVRRPPMVP
ncbi:CPBP family intramembrane glutamic endopeptidase [Streptomyces peucetius]|uniref:CPBP family glutamic-type intramembrane protease n=1 Tax=Streptomyces peucetius TaxID=1950 RepID=A0ABY6I190_STRPE|nr:CPBP family glutamic-type intramembrane protease [Streptomyces peucetius]UYQ60638.1 CPBP family glutamic-type intramembrane protease [Streptomyces peucetius]